MIDEALQLPLMRTRKDFLFFFFLPPWPVVLIQTWFDPCFRICRCARCRRPSVTSCSGAALLPGHGLASSAAPHAVSRPPTPTLRAHHNVPHHRLMPNTSSSRPGASANSHSPTVSQRARTAAGLKLHGVTKALQGSPVAGRDTSLHPSTFYLFIF